jgi:histidinol dehydrogenase
MMMADGSPVRVIGHWGKLSEQERKRALGRGLDKILDSGLSEDVRQRGDAAISAANFTIGCPDSLPTSGFAQVSSGITADALRKRTAAARADRHRALIRMSDSIIAFTGHEGFPANEAAVRIRMNRD